MKLRGGIEQPQKALYTPQVFHGLHPRGVGLALRASDRRGQGVRAIQGLRDYFHVRRGGYRFSALR